MTSAVFLCFTADDYYPLIEESLLSLGPKGAMNDLAAAWSPDGGQVAFLRDQGRGHFAVMLIPALGGPERKLTDIVVPDMEWMPGPYVSWTPDSRSLVLPDRVTAGKPVALFVFPVQVGDKRQLTLPPGGMLGGHLHRGLSRRPGLWRFAAAPTWADGSSISTQLLSTPTLLRKAK